MTKARDIASAIPAPSTVDATELGYLDGVTSAIQTQVDAKIAKTLTTTTGDIIYASGANTPARLGIGSTSQVLTVASGIPSWATPSSGGMTLISTTTLSGATTTLSSIPQTYNNLFLIISGVTGNTSDKKLRCLPNNVNNKVSQSGTKANTARRSDDATIEFSGPDSLTRTNNSNTWQLLITNYTSSTSQKPFQFSGYFVDGMENPGVNYGGSFVSNTAITSLVFDLEGTNTFASGTVLLYGVK